MTHGPTRPRAPARIRHAGLIAACLAIVGTAAVAFRVGASNQLPDPGWQVTATPLTDLLDGTTVSVTVKANDDVAINNLEIRQCRLGPTYVAQVDNSPAEGNCPSTPVSSSADNVKVRSASDGLVNAARSDQGATVDFKVGVGTATWDAASGQTTLTCDIDNPCALLAQVRVGPDYLYQEFTLRFTDADPVKACGGTATGVLKAQASDELTDAWANWTRQFCEANPGGAPSTTAFPSEGSAVNAFGTGDADLTYGSLGVDPTTGMLASDTPPRDAVAVPIALNAAVLAVGGGHRPAPGLDKVPYPQLQMLASDSAALLSNGKSVLQNDSLPYSASILSENPSLQGIAYYVPANILTSSLPSTSTWLLTSYFKAVAPADWVNRRTTPPTPRGQTSSLAVGFDDDSTLSGRPAMQKVTVPAALNDPDGPLWVFTDRATAASLSLTPVALDNGTGTFVSPTTDSMDAAVDAMQPGPLGVLEPTFGSAPQASASAAATPAYPLTYVVYAFAPAQPLVDPTTCAPRSASQALLTKWLQYITGPGQQSMAPGLEQLTPALQTQAQAQITKVGASPVTGPCAGAGGGAGTGSASGTGTGSNPLFAAATGEGSLPTSGVVPRSGAVPGPGGVPLSPAELTQKPAGTKAEHAVAIPAFAGHEIESPLGGVVALIGIVLVMSLGAWVTAGGRLSGGTMWTPGSLGALSPARIGSLVLLWSGVAVAGLGLVVFQLGPLLEQREQRSLLDDYRVTVDHAANERGTLQGITVSTKPPEEGSAVGILEIGALKTQDVVVEGASASQTARGPGHVPGTAGLGQPGNSVVVARRNAYGGSFRGLAELVKGDPVVVTTTQGQSVYAVRCVVTMGLDDSGSSTAPASASGATATTTSSGYTCPSRKASKAGKSTAASTTTTAASTTTSTSAPTSSYSTPGSGTPKSGSVSVDELYGPTRDDRLTLVTSGSKAPWNTSQATVVVARLVGMPYPPTVQGARSSEETGMNGDSGAWAAVTLALLAFVGVIVGSVVLYRRMRFRVAYVLTIAPLVAFTIIAGETLARLLPAWT